MVCAQSRDDAAFLVDGEEWERGSCGVAEKVGETLGLQWRWQIVLEKNHAADKPSAEPTSNCSGTRRFDAVASNDRCVIACFTPVDLVSLTTPSVRIVKSAGSNTVA